MNHILCPVSDEKVNEKIVRFIAFLTFLIALFFVYQPSIIIGAFLTFDFYSRGFGISRFSILSLAGFRLKNFIPFRSKTIDKAPKIFAARIGFILSLLALILLLSGAILSSQITIVVLAFFAFLEWSAGLCAGCYFYSWIILPYFSKW